jgi:hypothetical protein
MLPRAVPAAGRKAGICFISLEVLKYSSHPKPPRGGRVKNKLDDLNTLSTKNLFYKEHTASYRKVGIITLPGN